MGDVSSLFSTIGQGVGTAASDIGQGIGQVGGDLFSGAKDLVGNIGSGLGGLFGAGGGGPVSPGSIANNASSIAQAAGEGAAAAAPSAATSAASFGAEPGITAGLPDTTTFAPPLNPGTLATDPMTAAGTADFNQLSGQVAGQLPSPGTLTGGTPTSAPVNFNPGALSPGIGNPNFGFGGSQLLQSLLTPKTALPLGLVGYDVIKGSEISPEVKQLQQLAAQQGGIARTQGKLAEGEQEGLLPTGAGQLVEQTLRANEASIRTKYAQLGMSGSSAEQQDLQAARDESLAQTFQIGSQLAAQGFSEVNAATGQEDSLLAAIMQEKLQQGTDLGNALALFASGLAK